MPQNQAAKYHFQSQTLQQTDNKENPSKYSLCNYSELSHQVWLQWLFYKNKALCTQSP